MHSHLYNIYTKIELQPSFLLKQTIMRSLTSIIFVIFAFFSSLAAAQKRPSKNCIEVIQKYGPQCGVRIRAASCKKFFEDAGKPPCYTEFLESFTSPK